MVSDHGHCDGSWVAGGLWVVLDAHLSRGRTLVFNYIYFHKCFRAQQGFKHTAGHLGIALLALPKTHSFDTTANSTGANF